MINKSELRKGNIVTLSKQIVTIKEVFEETVLAKLNTGEEIFFSIKSIFPISITHTMLIDKLSFIKFSKSSGIYLNSIFVLDQDDGRFLTIPNNGPIYYLHELQNLYFETTNIELVFKI